MYSKLLLVAFVAAVVSAATYPTVPDDITMGRILRKVPTNKYCRTFSSSYESLSDFQYVTDNTDGSQNALDTGVVRSGTYSHKTTISAIEGSDHRQYAAYQPFKLTNGSFSTPAYIEAWVNYDVTIPNGGYFTLARIGADGGTTPGDRAVSVVVNQDNTLGLYYVPNQNNYTSLISLNTTTKIVNKKWTNITIYISYDSGDGIIAVWKDGDLAVSANVKGGTGKLGQVHFGLVAQNLIPSGVVYNDDLSVKEITENYKACSNGLIGVPAGTNGSSTITLGILAILAAILALL
jgi:hypothetical protein